MEYLGVEAVQPQIRLLEQFIVSEIQVGSLLKVLKMNCTKAEFEQRFIWTYRCVEILRLGYN